MTHSPHTSLGMRLLEGLHSNVLAQLFVLAINFAITPLIVRHMGPAGYALYTLMWTLLGYLALLTGGTLFATQRFTALYRNKTGPSPLGFMLRRTLLFQLTMAVIGAALLLMNRAWITTQLLQDPGQVLAATPRVFACVAVATPLYFALQFGLSMLYGMQKFGAYNLLQALQSSAVAICTAVILLTGGGLREIAASFIIVHGLLAAMALWLQRHTLLAPSEPQTGPNTEFIRYSAKIFLPYLLVVLTSQGDRIFIAALLPLSQIGYYVIASTMAQKFNMLCGSAIAIAFPMLTELHATGQEERLQRFYLKVSELSFFVFVPVTVLSFVLIPQFMTIWIGADFSAAATWPFRLLVLSNLALLGCHMPNTIAACKGEPQISSYREGGKALLTTL